MRIDSSKEEGFVYLVGSIVIGGFLLLCFAANQLVEGMVVSVRNYEATIKASQQGQSNTPFVQAALDAMAWACKFEGFEGTRAEQGLQQLTGVGDVEFTYNQGITPHQVFVYLAEDMPLLAGVFQGMSGTAGLETLDSAVIMGATSAKAFVSVHADVSLSMRGPADVVGEETVVKNLIEAYGFTTTIDRDDLCWPLEITTQEINDEKAVNPALTDDQARRIICNNKRRMLPFYYAGRARPLNDRYDLTQPVEPYNPGQDYSSYIPAEDNMMVCGDNEMVAASGNSCNPNDPDPNERCFPFAASNTQFGLMPPGMRVEIDFDLDDVACRNGTGVCPILSYQPGVSYPASDRAFCTLPWRIHPDFVTTREKNECNGITSGDEVPVANGCQSQYGMLKNHRSDFFDAYNDLTQAFLINLVETVPFVNFSTFSGATKWGAIEQLDIDGNPIVGNKLLYDSSAYPSGNMFSNPIDEVIKDLANITVDLGGGATDMIDGNLGYDVTSAFRLNHMLSYLDSDEFPSMNPLPGPNVFEAKDHAYIGSNIYSPIENPNSPFVNSGDYPGGVVPPGRCSTWELSEPGQHPTDYQAGYKFLKNWDEWDNAPKHFFPLANSMQPTPGFPFDASYFDGFGNGLYDWFGLREIDYSSGIQTGGSYTLETKIKNYTTCTFHYIKPTSGGTDTIAAFQSGLQGYQNALASDPSLPGVVLVVTDGKPNPTECAQSQLPAGMTCVPKINYGPADDPNTVLGKIKTELDALQALGSLVILLYIDQDSSASDPEVQQFLQLFEDEKDRVLLKFSFKDTSQFTEKFKESLTVIRTLIMSAAKPISG